MKVLGFALAALGVLSARAAAAQTPDRLAATQPGAEPAEPSGALQFRAGGTFRRLYDIPIFAGEFGAAIGGWDERGGDYATLDFIAPGRTENGLSVWGVAAGYRSDWQLSRLRLGFAAAIAVINVKRVTSDDSISSGGFALSGFVGVDLLRSSAGVLAVDAAFNADPTFGERTTLLWGPTLGLSYRL